MGITDPGNVAAREWRKQNKRDRVRKLLAATKIAQEKQRKKDLV